MKSILLINLLLIVYVSSSPKVEISIEVTDKPILVQDVSARDINPKHGAYENDKDKPTEKDIENWEKEHVFPIDFFVVIKNISEEELSFYEEWNSWGFYNLKFSIKGTFHEVYLTKKHGIWYRNFPSWHTLKKGESFKIPVALKEKIWSGVNKLKDFKPATIRAVYEQHGKESFFRTSTNLWNGIIISKHYDFTTLKEKKEEKPKLIKPNKQLKEESLNLID